MRKIIFCIMFLLLLTGCINHNGINKIPDTPKGDSAILGDDDKSFGEDLDKLEINDGYFEGETDVEVTCVSGSNNKAVLKDNVLTFSDITLNSVYKISGKIRGNVVVDVEEEYKIELIFDSLSIISKDSNPILIKSAKECIITIVNDESYIYDERDSINKEDEALYGGAIHSLVDLKINGEDKLVVVSKNNYGINSKKDLEMNNVKLIVYATDNIIKGNDSVTLNNVFSRLIATKGDVIKTTNSDISSKGNQRGIIKINSGNHLIYAACDGISAAYNVNITGNPKIEIYTDKYSNYSSEVTETSKSVYYIRNNNKNYKYSIKYYNSEEDYKWVNADYHSSVSGGRSQYYYYSFDKLEDYAKLQLFIYNDQQTQQGLEYVKTSEIMSINSSYDTIAISNNRYSWTNYSKTVNDGGFRPGPGGFNEGNSDKAEYSSKGIKAANEIVIDNGTISIKSYDDGIHANNDDVLENSNTPLGNVTIKGGNISIYSNDDGIHADSNLLIKDGTVTILYSYEGLEGVVVEIQNGYVTVNSKDDGINSTNQSGEGVIISGGINYIYASGDGIDSNSKTSYKGIVFNGGKTVVISTSNGNSAIDTEKGYTYNGGYVLAIMPTGGMTSESTHCSNFNSIAKKENIKLDLDKYLVVSNDKDIVLVKNKISNAVVIFLGDKNINFKQESYSMYEEVEWK